MDLSIIIVSYNVKDLLRDCLNSIFQNTRRISYEIFVVDNNSSDGSAEMVKTEFPNVNLIENKENLGFARANNQAIRICNGRYILLLNPDTIVLPDALDLMVEFMDKNLTTGAIGCELLYPDGRPQLSLVALPSPWLYFVQLFGLKKLLPSVKLKRWIAGRFGFFLGRTVRSHIDPYHYQLNDAGENYISGACLMVRKETINQVGLLDENFFMYLEDADWCLRIGKAGWRICVCPQARVIHYLGQSPKQASFDGSLEKYKRLYYYFKKHYKTKIHIIKLIVISASLARIVSLLLLSLLSPRQKERLKENLYSWIRIIKLSLIA